MLKHFGDQIPEMKMGKRQVHLEKKKSNKVDEKFWEAIPRRTEDVKYDYPEHDRSVATHFGIAVGPPIK